MVAAAAARAALTRRHEVLVSALARVDQENERLRTATAERAANQLITPIHVASLMGLTALAVFAAMMLAIADRRAAARVLREERASSQSSLEELERSGERLMREIELLGADIHRIADGDLGLRAHTDAGDTPGVGVARAGLDRLRQLLGRRREDALTLARSGQVVGDVAGRLREVARRHVHQVEDAGQATRVMAAALEALRQESTQVAERPRRKGRGNAEVSSSCQKRWWTKRGLSRARPTASAPVTMVPSTTA